MTALCRQCGGAIEPGDYLPFRHIAPEGRGHYASPVRASRSAAETRSHRRAPGPLPTPAHGRMDLPSLAGGATPSLGLVASVPMPATPARGRRVR